MAVSGFRYGRLALLALSLGALASCLAVAPSEPVSTGTRPVNLTPPSEPSLKSEELRRYYRRAMADGQTRGLMRTDGGGPDTPFTSEMLLRNFEQIAFLSEYERGAQPLRRWSGPVRIKAHFGATVDPASKTRDSNALISYVSRLARVTGHSVSVTSGPANFHVFFVSEDDRAAAVEKISQLEPDLDAYTLNDIRRMPRSTYCQVLALSETSDIANYRGAIAIIRAEQPDLMRLSCIHEELAQGLGLPNDSPHARPSIFNDDDEFALLTTHDEKLLAMLYDPRLKTGMSVEAARPILRILAREATGEEL